MRKAVILFKSVLNVLAPGKMPSILKNSYHLEQFRRVPFRDVDFLAQIHKVIIRYRLLDKEYFLENFDEISDEISEKDFYKYDDNEDP